MIEEKIEKRVRVLGVQVDSVKVDRAVSQTIRFLEKHKFEYIVFANTSAALSGKEGAGIDAYINNAALVLPGDTNVEDAVEVRQWLAEGKTYQAEYFRRLFTRLNKQRASVYLMIEKEEQLSKIDRIIHEKYNRLQKEEILWKEESSIDSLVNSINSLAPDLLFICAKHEKISRFLEEHGCKINAGICFCVEEIVTDADTDISDWMHASKIQKTVLETKNRISRFFHDFLFKKQMKQIRQEEEFFDDRKEAEVERTVPEGENTENS